MHNYVATRKWHNIFFYKSTIQKIAEPDFATSLLRVYE